MTRSSLLIWLTLSVAWASLWIAQVTFSGWCNDESAHIPAGLYHLETGRMEAYRVNPPLPRMIAALPLLVDGPDLEWFTSEAPLSRIEYQFAHQWITDNQPSIPRYLLLTRLTVVIFFALGLWSITRWAQELYGTAAAVVAGAMWALNPDVLTHSAVVAPDLPAASAGLFAGFQFWRWLRREQRPFPWVVAAAVALAILCKFSWLFLLLAFPLVTFATDWFFRSRVRDETDSEGTHWAANREGWICRDATRLCVSFLLTLLIINWVYGFDGSGEKLGDFGFVSRTLGGPDLPRGKVGNRFSDGPLRWIPVPLPKQMILGLDFLRYEFEGGMRCYLRGTWQQGGWWYFHVYAMAVKIPLGYWVLIAIGVASLVLDARHRRVRGSLEWIPLLIAVTFVAMVSSQTGFTHHVRYVLPAYGFLFIVASRVMIVLPGRAAKMIAAASLAGVILFHATHLGLAHTFFNPAAGGPNHGWRHLSHSNSDWGQSTYRMVDWIKSNPDKRPLTVLFRSHLGSPAKLVEGLESVSTQVKRKQSYNGQYSVPTQVGWFLISSYQMTLEPNRFFRDRKPIDQPAPDFLLFYLPGNEVP